MDKAIVVNDDVENPEELEEGLLENESGTEGSNDGDAGSDGAGGDSEASEDTGGGDDSEVEASEPEEKGPERHTRNWREKRLAKRQKYLDELATRDALISQLQTQINEIQRRNIGADLVQIDQQLQQLNQAYMNEQQAMADAFTAQDAAAHSRAISNMQEIRDRFQNLQQVKKTVEQRQRQPAPVDPRVVMYAEDWKNRNSWYNPEQTDDDSREAARIDKLMAAEGFNPTTYGYWQELDRRLAVALPHRFKGQVSEAASPPSRPKPPSPVGSGGRPAPSGNRGNGTLSPERVAAIKEAGMWNDPEKRKKAIANYQRYDREHANG